MLFNFSSHLKVQNERHTHRQSGCVLVFHFEKDPKVIFIFIFKNMCYLYKDFRVIQKSRKIPKIAHFLRVRNFSLNLMKNPVNKFFPV